MTNEQEMYVLECVQPLDWFDVSTKRVDDWLNELPKFQLEQVEGWKLFLMAVAAVQQHLYWDGELRRVPRVGYNPQNDQRGPSGIYFIFKLDNNGTTFLVSQDELPEVKGSTLTNVKVKGTFSGFTANF